MRRRARARGVSLVEVLASMTLFALVASAASGLAVASIRHTTQNRHASIAAMLAQRELEDLRGLDFDEVASRASTVVEGGLAYAVASDVEADTPGPGMKTITVRVGWSGPEGALGYDIGTVFTSIR
jgi:prepilin-type N-terminal cleavage/methylation domain-containing protein